MTKVAVVGHLAIDKIIRLRETRSQLGGPPTYAALTARVLNAPIDIRTKAGNDIPGKFIDTLRSFGIKQKYIVEGTKTTRFNLDYRGDKRILSVESICEEIKVKDVLDLPELTIVAPIICETPPLTLEAIEADILAFDPQGLLRKIGDDGYILLRHWRDDRFLRKITAFKSSKEELKFITGENDTFKSLRKISKIGAEISISTLGKEGCILCLKNKGYKLPAYDTITVDPTGAGDIFLSTFAILFSRGEEPLWCCSMATAMSSCIVETRGAHIEADMKEIKNRAYCIYNKVEKI